jgi:hypothetical protein
LPIGEIDRRSRTMTPQEKELLSAFLQQLTAAHAGQKDAEAETLIREAVARQPDAAYLLVQRALQLDQALQMTQAQAQKLQAELDEARSAARASGGGTSFLGDSSWGSRPSAAPQAVPQQRSVSGLPLGAPPATAPAQPAPAPRPSPWGGGSMLGTVASTAAGVVAGSFLFQGIQNLMHRNDPTTSAGHAWDTHSAAALPADSDGNIDTEALGDIANIPDDDSDTFAAGDDDSDFA